jgi:hypothetical protein
MSREVGGTLTAASLLSIATTLCIKPKGARRAFRRLISTSTYAKMLTAIKILYSGG